MSRASLYRALLLGLATFILALVFFPTQFAVVCVVAALPVIIMLHEGSHFLAAKRSGMKVTEFFVGFGPRVWSITKGETEYGIKAIPLGGYCRIVGMTSMEEIEPGDEERTYRSKGYFSRVFVAGAGPAMHFVLAGILMFTVLWIGGDVSSAHPTNVLTSVSAGAQKAGLHKGDQVTAIDGTAVTSWEQLAADISGPKAHPHHAGDQVSFTVVRAGQTITKVVTLQADTTDNNRPIAGVTPHYVTPHPGLFGSLILAPRRVVSITGSAIGALGSTFSPHGIVSYYHTVVNSSSSSSSSSKAGSSAQQSQGTRFVSPVGFAKLANDAVKSGWVDALGLLIVINIFVGVFNLLPIMPFDGGHIAVATYEQFATMITRRKIRIDTRKLMPITGFVLTVLLLIFVSSLFLDVTRGVPNPF